MSPIEKFVLTGDLVSDNSYSSSRLHCRVW